MPIPFFDYANREKRCIVSGSREEREMIKRDRVRTLASDEALAVGENTLIVRNDNILGERFMRNIYPVWVEN